MEGLGGPILLPRSVSRVESLTDSLVMPRHSPYLRSDGLYRSLISATFDVSNTRVRPDVSDAVTFLSFTSMPTSPRVSVSAISFEKAMLTARPVRVMEPS